MNCKTKSGTGLATASFAASSSPSENVVDTTHVRPAVHALSSLLPSSGGDGFMMLLQNWSFDKSSRSS